MQASLAFMAGCLAVALALGGCATTEVDTPLLMQADPRGGYRFVNMNRHPDNSSSLFVVVTFSGGGTRAAALSYGVLQELSRIEVTWQGRRRRLLDEVDLISAVSGGSVPAAYYALVGERIFDDFETRFLHRDVDVGLKRKLLNPRNWARLWGPTFGRSDLVAEHLDDLLFDGATYASLLGKPGPFVVLSATDMVAGNRFEFSQEQFDLMCADLARFPVSRAVAASAAVPVLLSPIVVRNQADRCAHPDYSAIHRARDAGQLTSRQRYQVDKLFSYLNVEERPYIHLLDGGLADNLGLRSPLEAVFMRRDAWSLVLGAGIADVRKVVFIVVNASTGPDVRWNRIAALPGIAQALRAFKDITIDRYTFETKELLAASFERWAADITSQRLEEDNALGLEFVMVDVDLEALTDRQERVALRGVPTSFSIGADKVTRLQQAARTLLNESPAFQGLLRELEGTRGERTAPGRMPSSQP